MINNLEFRKTLFFILFAMVTVCTYPSLVPSVYITDSSDNKFLKEPDFIKILCEDDITYIIKGSKGRFKKDRIEVFTDNKNGKTIFYLKSPSMHIKSVTAVWNVLCMDSVKILGDHWERGYGDLEWKSLDENRIMPWYFIEYDGLKCNAMGVMTGCNSFCSWKVSQNSTELEMDVRNGTHGVILNERVLKMASLVCYEGGIAERPFVSATNFCRMMCPNPRLPKEPVYGINDWYFAYGNNSDDLIMQTVYMVKDLIPNNSNKPYCLIDAGWACLAPGKSNAGCWSDNFYTPGTNFKDMKGLASRIKENGMHPGLWMRPLCAPFGADESRLLPLFNRSDSPKDRILDPTVKENQEYIRRCFDTYKEWGFEMVKHDFTTVDILGKWGFEMVAERNITRGDWCFADKNHTTAEIILDLYKIIRQAAGNICIIGCNTVSHLAAGLFEIQRTGDDTSGKEWAGTLKMGVNTLAFRAPQHNTFYSADSDCVGLTEDVDWKNNKKWMELLAMSGTPLFISAQPKAVGVEQRDWIKKCFEIASKPQHTAEPLNWTESLTPTRWNFDGIIKTYDWSE